MQRMGIARKFAAMAAAIALCATPTIAHASTAASAQSISPLVALSVFGTQASAQAVCGSAATEAASAAAATAAQGQPGCVLPAVDTPATPPVGETPPISPAASPRGFGISPFLLGLIGIAALAALIAAGNKGGNEPQSP